MQQQRREHVYSDHGKAISCFFPSNDLADDGRLTPRTPGIWTTERRGRTGYNPGTSATQGDAAGDYASAFDGTSSACPGVAGIAALVLSRSPGLTHREVREVIERSATRIDAEAGENDGSGHILRYGFGRANAASAVRLADRALA